MCACDQRLAVAGGGTVKLLSEREQVRTVAKRWRDRYPDPEFRLRDGRTAGEIADRLDALDPETATAEDVGVAMGRRSWVCQQTCYECWKDSWSCVEIGEEPNDESCTATICEGCLRKALALIEWERLAEEAKRSRAEFADVVKRNLVDRLAASGSAAGADVTGTDPAHGRDWTAVLDTPKDGEP